MLFVQNICLRPADKHVLGVRYMELCFVQYNNEKNVMIISNKT